MFGDVLKMAIISNYRWFFSILCEINYLIKIILAEKKYGLHFSAMSHLKLTNQANEQTFIIMENICKGGNENLPHFYEVI